MNTDLIKAILDFVGSDLFKCKLILKLFGHHSLRPYWTVTNISVKLYIGNIINLDKCRKVNGKIFDKVEKINFERFLELNYDEEKYTDLIFKYIL